MVEGCDIQVEGCIVAIADIDAVQGHGGSKSEGYEQQDRHHRHKHKVLFVFGDSYVDTGNRNIPTSPSWKDPYGMTFPGKPSGRFSDGRVLTDFVAAYMGIPTPITCRTRHLVAGMRKRFVCKKLGGVGGQPDGGKPEKNPGVGGAKGGGDGAAAGGLHPPKNGQHTIRSLRCCPSITIAYCRRPSTPSTRPSATHPPLPSSTSMLPSPPRYKDPNSKTAVLQGSELDR
ncbi:uncharacterized protein LOC116257994 [Nymphaea colorata]|nr:uncharacterized protein LOC116257994 [Nymphaea colorata]